MSAGSLAQRLAVAGSLPRLSVQDRAHIAKKIPIRLHRRIGGWA